jgi:coenzyme PQQ precursor peptide PqqA
VSVLGKPCVPPQRVLYWQQSPCASNPDGFFTRRPQADSPRKGVFSMEWTKPEFTVVAVTMEVTAYAATK